jgi:aspartyl-tRNA(Asn)/glutamyl-tRNA(Gln) amidotransferase subunit A
MDDLTRFTISEASDLIARREVSPVELTIACIHRSETLEPRLNAYITPTFETAILEARQAEVEIAGGRYRGPLQGIPLALKDLFETAGVRTTAGSPFRDMAVPTTDAAVVTRLKEAGAVFLGKLNLHEWALGVTNINAHYPSPRNPWDTARITGGSSGGSAAATAAEMAFGSLGTDTGGSIRIPAALCGITGLKPTYGRVSTRGAIPLAWSLDHVGPMARTAADCALLLDAIAGYDEADPHSLDVPALGFSEALTAGIANLRIGVPRDFFYDTPAVDTDVIAAVEAAIAIFAGLGAEIVEVSLGEFVPPNELAVFLAEAVDYHRARLDEAPEMFGPSVLSRLRAAETLSAADHAAARERQRQSKRTLARVFEKVDLLVMPTTVSTAPLFPEDREETTYQALNGRASGLLGRNTRPFNVTGVPAISVPCGFNPGGLPVGLQIVGSWWQEAIVLRAAHAFQTATDWHHRRPESGSSTASG